MIRRSQNHGVVLVRVDDHAVYSIPCSCYVNFVPYAQVKGDRITVTVVQLLVVCVCMKFHILGVVEKVIQEDVDQEHDDGPSTVPCGTPLLTACEIYNSP